MKPALIVAVTLTLLVNFSPRCKAELSTTHKANAADSNTPPTLVVAERSNELTANDNEGGSKPTPKGDEAPEWVLVVVGIVTASVIGWQSWETRRAATATQRSASILESQSEILKRSVAAAENNAAAAKVSAQTIMNAERPWMFIDIERADGEHPLFFVKFVNQGRTPAEVVNLDLHLDPRESTDDFPSSPKYLNEGSAMVSTRMVAAGQPFTPPGEASFHLPDNFSSETWDEIIKSRKRATFWGRLVYRDLIEYPVSLNAAQKEYGILHETCFCYFWSPSLNEFLITGPLGYNKHT